MRNEKYGVIVCVLITLTLVLPSSGVFAGVKQGESNQIPKAVINGIIGTNEENGNQRLYSFEFSGRDNDGYIKSMRWYLDNEEMGRKFCSASYVTWDATVYVDGDLHGKDHVVKLVVVDDKGAIGYCTKSFTVVVSGGEPVDSGSPKQGDDENEKEDGSNGAEHGDEGGSGDVEYGSVTLTLLEQNDEVFVGDRIKVEAVMDEESDGSLIGASSTDGTRGSSYDYKFVFNWGDGSNVGVSFSNEKNVEIVHRYSQPNADGYVVVVNGYYKNEFVGSDSIVVFVYDREEVPLDGDDGVKIYGNHMFAQSFKPWFENLTFVNLSVGCVANDSMGNSEGSVSTSSDDDHVGLLMRVRKLFFDDSGFIGLIMRIINMFLGRTTGSNSGSSSQGSNSDSNPLGGKLGNLIISIRSDLYGEDLVSKSFTPNEVKNCGGKLIWKLDKEYPIVRSADDPYWEEHGLDPINEDYNKVFYIVVRTNGGDEDNYYTWMYGDNYSYGMAWEWIECYNEWMSDTYNVWGKDFGFELGGRLFAWEKTGGDGVVNQYNIVHLWDSNGEKVSPFLKGETFFPTCNSHLLELIDKIDSLCDGDDVIVLWLVGDGSPYKPMINGLSAYSIEKHFERIPETKGICMIFNCCYAGQFTDPSKSPVCKPGRVIIASCAADETDYMQEFGGELWGAFSYYLYQGLQKGYKTAEDLFHYASPKHDGNEQIYDTYPGELQIAK